MFKFDTVFILLAPHCSENRTHHFLCYVVIMVITKVHREGKICFINTNAVLTTTLLSNYSYSILQTGPQTEAMKQNKLPKITLSIMNLLWYQDSSLTL